MPPAIVFDLDGTLIDSAPDIQGIANRLLAGAGAAPLDLDEVRAFIGNGVSVFVARMRAARGIPDSDHAGLLAGFAEAYDAAVHLTQPYPGVASALAALSGSGFRLGICTNKPVRPARAVLHHLGLSHHFAAILGGDSLPQRKPDPAPLLAGFAALGGGARRIYVGDSEVDAETARRAGVPFLLFTRGYRKAPVAEIPHSAAFDDFAELPALVAASLG